MNKWFLLYTKFREEERAKLNLESQGIVAYYPKVNVERIKKNKRHFVEEPLFPRYLFIAINEFSPCFSSIQSTRGVSNLVKFSGHLAQVPDKVIERIQIRESQNEVIFTAPKVGDKVKITSGPFIGIDAIIKEKHGTDRVMLLLTLMNKQVSLKTDYSTLTITA